MGTERWGLEAALELQADSSQLKTALMFPLQNLVSNGMKVTS